MLYVRSVQLEDVSGFYAIVTVNWVVAYTAVTVVLPTRVTVTIPVFAAFDVCTLKVLVKVSNPMNDGSEPAPVIAE